MSKKNNKAKDHYTHPKTGSHVMKRGKFVFVPIPAEVFDRAIGWGNEFHWTELEYSLQLSRDEMSLSIPGLADPEKEFEDQPKEAPPVAVAGAGSGATDMYIINSTGQTIRSWSFAANSTRTTDTGQ